MKKVILSLLFLFLSSCANKALIEDGSYVFQHKLAEHPTLKSISFDVTISGLQITVTNNNESGTWPKGLVEEGLLFLHSSNQWIIVQNKSDRNANEVGGCTGGPTVVDLVQKLYWTC